MLYYHHISCFSTFYLDPYFILKLKMFNILICIRKYNSVLLCVFYSLYIGSTFGSLLHNNAHSNYFGCIFKLFCSALLCLVVLYHSSVSTLALNKTIVKTCMLCRHIIFSTIYHFHFYFINSFYRTAVSTIM